jgi:hypothetical protein
LYAGELLRPGNPKKVPQKMKSGIKLHLEIKTSLMLNFE